jgi:cytochrome c biogenesis protein CcmG/thiol:disulfide interchange protein DsbE
MRKLLSIVAVILVATLVLLLLSSCKLSEENDNKEENISGDLTEETKKDQDDEGNAEEDKDKDTENHVNSDVKGENEIEYFNDFTLLDLDENEVSLSDFQGKIVVLNFWATWCPPCREEIPDFIEVNDLYKDKNVQIIGVSIDTDMKALEDFVEEFGIDYPTWIDGTIDKIGPVWGVRAIPTTFFLNENGEVIFKNIGMMTKEQLIEILDEILRMSA